MDYRIWSISEARACAKPHKHFEVLEQSLQRRLDLSLAEALRRTSLNFWKPLTLCTEADGGQFEANQIRHSKIVRYYGPVATIFCFD